MSAIARYFKVNGRQVAGYDKTATKITDALEEIGIDSIGPKKEVAKLETSKSFTRELLEKYNLEQILKTYSY